MSNKQYFHFTIGPVQGFVAQARRTRDFWGGSFLLSWLAGVAMLAVEKQGGTVVFPKPEDDYLKWIREGKGNGDAPQQGAIPNRFMAEVKEDFDPNIVKATVQEAWRLLAEEVWTRDNLDEVAGKYGNKTREIWNRQIANFWEISWILTEKVDSSLLDKRKNWRNYFPEPEPGEKCMVMEGWQELSGAERPDTRKDKHIAKFWNAILDKDKDGIKTDLRETERLCAIAYVKRRFVRYFEHFSPGAEINGIRLKGWKVPAGRPSVSYMAAVHWIEQLLKHPDIEKVWSAFDLAHELSPKHSEWETRIQCIEQVFKDRPDIKRRDISVDGNVFFEAMREDIKLFPDQEKAKQLGKAFRDLDIKPPSPFYAILLMDGDSLGVHMGDPDNQAKIAKALNEFTKAVQGIVDENNGSLIYAGGDDVLAILPLEDAFKCARELHDEYGKRFEGTGIPSTLSGAIQFAHIKMPLGRVLLDAHSLLDDVAKEGCGRDAIAARVWKPGGCALTWAQPWDVALSETDENMAEDIFVNEVVLEATANQFAAQQSGQSADDQTMYSSKFFYKIRERFDLLNPQKGAPAVLDNDAAISLLAAEYLSSGVHQSLDKKPKLDDVKKMITPLLRQCRPQKRQWDKDGQLVVENGKQVFETSDHLEVDGALLVRFLAHKGMDVR